MALRGRMKAIAHKRRLLGYRRIHVLLKREGDVFNHKCLFKVYLEENLFVRNRCARKRALGTRAPMLVHLCIISKGLWTLCQINSPIGVGLGFSL